MIGKKLTCQAPAKINLALHVTGQMLNGQHAGYHLIESLVVFTRFGDTIAVKTGSQSEQPADTINYTGPFSDKLTAALNEAGEDGGHDLIKTAANLIRTRLDKPVSQMQITLDKHLPVASGMGGGSADAAAALLAFNALGLNITKSGLMRLAAKLGSDVPMCLFSRPLIARGLGEKLEFVEAFPELALVLVNPGVPVSTPQVFSRLIKCDNPPLSSLPDELNAKNLYKWLALQRNDLEPAAISIAPEIDDCLNALKSSGAILARMSGSGATCFGIYDSFSAAEIAASMIAKVKPDWWVKASVTQAHGMDRVK